MFRPRLDILPVAQVEIWSRLTEIPGHFVLYGGTALALRLGHRASVDFDFLSAEACRPEALRGALRLAKGAEVLQSRPNTLTVRTAGQPGVRLSFSGGRTLGQIEPPDCCEANRLHAAGLRDLFATRLNVLHQRAEAKDYLDVDALLQAGLDLELGLGCARAVYGAGFNVMLPLKALTYFEAGDLPSLSPDVRARLLAAVTSVRTPVAVAPCSERVGPS